MLTRPRRSPPRWAVPSVTAAVAWHPEEGVELGQEGPAEEAQLQQPPPPPPPPPPQQPQPEPQQPELEPEEDLDAKFARFQRLAEEAAALDVGLSDSQSPSSTGATSMGVSFPHSPHPPAAAMVTANLARPSPTGQLNLHEIHVPHLRPISFAIVIRRYSERTSIYHTI
jgi:hypothetical protein